MTLSQYLRALRARQSEFIGIVAVSIGIGVGWALLATPQYSATATVWIDQEAQDPLNRSAPSNVQASAFMSTQMDLISSERVARKVIDAEARVGFLVPRWKQQWQRETPKDKGDFAAWTAERLARRLSVRPTRESGVINLAFTATDPAVAARLTNAYVQAYIDTSLDLRLQQAQDTAALLRKRSEQLRGELEAAERRLADFQRNGDASPAGSDRTNGGMAQRLQRDVVQAQNNYESIARRSNEAELQSLSRLHNIAVLKQATAPALPSSPRLHTQLAVSAFIGIALALVAVMLRERGDRRLRDREDLAQDLGIALLVEVASPVAGMSNRPSKA